MRSLLTLKSDKDFEDVYLQMLGLYGEQSHIPSTVLKEVSKFFPDIFLSLQNTEKEILGHLIILPFNESGLAKITDDNTFEEEFTLEDFALESCKKEKVYFFVYSIYGKTDRLSSIIIAKLYKALARYAEIFHEDSLIFAECVSEAGVRVSEKMGLRKYFSYVFDGEELHLYKATLRDFIHRAKLRPILEHKILSI